MPDLLVRHFLGGAHQAIAGIADDHVDMAERSKGEIDASADRRGLGEVELRKPELAAVFRL